MLPRYRFNTHTEVLAPGQTGKTSALKYAGRIHILAGNQIIRQSWKSDLYEHDVAFTAEALPEAKIILLNPSKLEPSMGFNSFRVSGELSSHVENLSRAILANVSRESLHDFQSYAEASEAFFAFLAVTNQTPYDARALFEDLRAWKHAAQQTPEPYKTHLARFSALRPREFEMQTGTLRRRLRPFINSKALRIFTSGTYSVHQLLNDGYSIFFNGAPSNLLSLEAARIVNGLFLSEQLSFGIQSLHRIHPIHSFMDEIQEYASDDFASAIDLVLGSKLRFVLSHHHAQQFSERLRQSVETNARIKILGGGLPPEVRRHYAEIAYAAQLNQLHKKQAIYGTKTNYSEDEVVSTTERDDGISSTTTSTRLVPEQEQYIQRFEFFSRDEVLARYAASFLVPDRHFTSILPNGTVHRFEVPYLLPRLYNSPESVHFIAKFPNGKDPAERSPYAASTRTKKVRAPKLFEG